MWRKTLHASLPWAAASIVIDAADGEYAELICRLNNEPEVRKFLGGPLRVSVDDTREKLNEAPDRLYVIKVEGAAIGYSGFIENDKTGATDILVIIDPRYQGNGAGKEVVLLMLREFRDRFPERHIALTTQRENTKAQRLLDSIGFSQTGEYDDFLGFNYYVYRHQDDFAT